MGMIRAAGLVHEYFRRDEAGNVEAVQTALDQVDMEVFEGEFAVIIGSNGSGKSTLAKHLNALLTPTEGALWVDGKDTSDHRNVWDVRSKAGMVFQNPDNQLVANVVEEDVGFGPENLGVPTDEIWTRVLESLQSVGMLKYKKSPPNRLSGGQKQRVAIAGVLAMQPKCIVLDEPTAMLDPSGRVRVMETVRELNKKRGITVIWITHDMEEALWADRIFVMDKGRVVMQGTPRQVFSKVETLKQLKLDVPQMTLLACELKKGGLALPDGILTKGELLAALKNLLL